MASKNHHLEFIPLGGAGEVGRSCYLVGDGEKYVMLDCGVSPKSGAPPNFGHLKDKKVLAVLVSHSHRDHLGALPLLFKEIKDVKVFSTKLTKKLSDIALKDAIRVKRRGGETPTPIPPKLMEEWQTKEYYKKFRLGKGITVTFKDAGHIPGSAQVLLNWGKVKILYTGDICAFKTRMSGKFSKTRKADVIISESTYGKEISKPSKSTSVIEEEKKLVNEAKKILQQKGRILIPSFANGRAQEIMYTIAEAMEKGEVPKVPCYSIGLLNTMLGAIEEDSAFAEKSTKIKKYFNSIPHPRSPHARAEADKPFLEMKESTDSCIIVSTPGMLTMGTSSNLAIKIFDEPKSAIFIVGYQDEDSPGRWLQKIKRGGKFKVGDARLKVRCWIKKFKIKGHIHPRDLVKTVAKADPKLVLYVHGDYHAQNTVKRHTLPLAEECWVFSGDNETSLKLNTDTWEYELIDLKGVYTPKKEKYFVVDGLLEKILREEEFAQYKEFTTKKKEPEKFWNEEVLKAKFIDLNTRITSGFYWSVGGYPKRVRFVVKGEKKKIKKAISILKNPKVIEPRVRIGWLPYEGKARFNELIEWLRQRKVKIDSIPHPVFDSLGQEEGRGGLYKPKGKIYINPLVDRDEDHKKAVLYHEITHHLMDVVRQDIIELSKKHGLMGKAFVEGGAEYLAYKLGGDRIFIETEKVGDDGVYYPTSESNPYVSGWYMYKTIDEVMGEKKSIEILFGKSPQTLKRTYVEAIRNIAPLARLLKRTANVGRLYIHGVMRGLREGVKMVLQYARGINEGRLYVGKRVWTVKNLKESKSLLYRFGKFFGIIRNPWLEADCIREITGGGEDFSYKIPPEELSRMEVHKLYSARASQKKRKKLSPSDKKGF